MASGLLEWLLPLLRAPNWNLQTEDRSRAALGHLIPHGASKSRGHARADPQTEPCTVPLPAPLL
jgi:hypothetical protein